MPQIDDAQSADLIRTISKHTLSYVLYSISEISRHYDFDTIDLLIIHAILNANMLNITKSPALDRSFMESAEPDVVQRQGVSRAALSRFLSIPGETVRRRVDRLKKESILSEAKDGLIVTEQNRFR